MSDKDLGNLLAIIDSCSKINSFTIDTTDAESFYKDEKTFDAVLMNFMVIGESVSRLSNELKETAPQVNWLQIKGLRNIVAHDYFGVDAEEVWQIIKRHLPELELEVLNILGRE